MHIRTAEIEDASSLLTLYKQVAQSDGGIARQPDEITEDYIQGIVTKSMEAGLILVAEDPDREGALIASIHAFKKGLRAFDHVLSDLTIVVREDHQGKKVGRTIFTIFLEEIYQTRPDIGRVELIVRESNRKAISFYESLGFRIEGRMEMRIKTAGGSYEADIPMSWQNPNYEF